MSQRKRKALPRRLEELTQKIETWRATREKRTWMPEELWAEAVEVAREHGIWQVCNATRVRYASLKARMERDESRAAAAAVDSGGTGTAPVAPAVAGSADAAGSGFVSVTPAPPLFGPAEPPVTEVELVAVDGARLVVRVEGREGLDVAGLARAFWSRAT